MNPFHPYEPPRLTIELVPSPQWEDNLRSHLTEREWDSLRNACYTRAGSRCEVCGGRGRKHPVECHEIWQFDDSWGVQTLLGLVALCPDCHKVKHIGFAASRGPQTLARALNHLMRVNQWPEDLTEAYVAKMFEIWRHRSRRKWKLNLSWLDNAKQYIEQAPAVGREALKARVLASMTMKSSQHTSQSGSSL